MCFGLCFSDFFEIFFFFRECNRSVQDKDVLDEVYKTHEAIKCSAGKMDLGCWVVVGLGVEVEDECLVCCIFF